MIPIKFLQCPECSYTDLIHKEECLQCPQCTQSYPIINGTPCFIPVDKKNTVDVHARTLPLWKKALRFLKPPHHSVYFDNMGNTHFEGSELTELLQQLPEGAKVLNIGSLSRKVPIPKHITIYNVDISPYSSVDIVADGHNLPIKKESFDCVILKNVLEHVEGPDLVVKHAHRILKKKGLLYIKNPFLQPYHAVPDDFYRWTCNGNKEFFQGFKQLSFDVAIGPSSTVSWILREYFAMLFSLNSKKLHSINLIIFGWLTFWIKYLDFFLRSNPMSHYLASAFYGVYQKQ